MRTPIGSSVAMVANLTTAVVPLSGEIDPGGVHNIPMGASIELDITLTAGEPIGLYETSTEADPSRLEFSSSSVISIDSVQFFDDTIANGGSEITGILTAGSDVYIRATVTDPFGFDDITGATLEFFNPDGQNVLPVLEGNVRGGKSGRCDKTVRIPLYMIPDFTTNTGNWIAVVTATEGAETPPVTHTSAAILQVGQLPSLTVVKTRDIPVVSSGGIVEYTMTFTSAGPAMPKVWS